MHDTILLCDDFRREWDRWAWPKLGQREPIICAGSPGRSKCLYFGLCQTEAEPWELDEMMDKGIYNFEGFSWRPHRWAPWRREGENE